MPIVRLVAYGRIFTVMRSKTKEEDVVASVEKILFKIKEAFRFLRYIGIKYINIPFLPKQLFL